MIAIFDKKLRCFVAFKDLRGAGQYVGVHSSTVSRRLPLYEDSNFIIGECRYEKSGKGTNNLPQVQ